MSGGEDVPGAKPVFGSRHVTPPVPAELAEFQSNLPASLGGMSSEMMGPPPRTRQSVCVVSPSASPSPVPFLLVSLLFFVLYLLSVPFALCPPFLVVSVAFGFVTLWEICESIYSSVRPPGQKKKKSKNSKDGGFLAADHAPSHQFSAFWYAFPLRLWALFLPTVFALGLNEFAESLDNNDATRVVGVILSTGLLIGTFGFTVAHELLHSRHLKDQYAAWTMTTLVYYGHWNLEHRYHHHKFVSTPLDPATALRGQSFYSYLGQTVGGTFKTAWSRGGAGRGQRRVLSYLACSACVTCACVLRAGVAAGVAYHLVVSALAIMLLEVVQYVEHYGLKRSQTSEKANPSNADDYEAVGNMHSWNAKNSLTDLILFNLQHHAHHHADPKTEYHMLDANYKGSSPQLVLPYSSMALLSLVPPMFFSSMDRRLKALQSGAIEASLSWSDTPAVLTAAGLATLSISLLRY